MLKDPWTRFFGMACGPLTSVELLVGEQRCGVIHYVMLFSSSLWGTVFRPRM